MCQSHRARQLSGAPHTNLAASRTPKLDEHRRENGDVSYSKIQGCRHRSANSLRDLRICCRQPAPPCRHGRAGGCHPLARCAKSGLAGPELSPSSVFLSILAPSRVDFSSPLYPSLVPSLHSHSSPFLYSLPSMTPRSSPSPMPFFDSYTVLTTLSHRCEPRKPAPRTPNCYPAPRGDRPTRRERIPTSAGCRAGQVAEATACLSWSRSQCPRASNAKESTSPGFQRCTRRRCGRLCRRPFSVRWQVCSRHGRAEGCRSGYHAPGAEGRRLVEVAVLVYIVTEKPARMTGARAVESRPLLAGKQAPRVTPPPEESSCTRRYNGALLAVRPDEPSRRPTARRSSFRRYLEMFGCRCLGFWRLGQRQARVRIWHTRKKTTFRVSLDFPSLGSRRDKKGRVRRARASVQPAANSTVWGDLSRSPPGATWHFMDAAGTVNAPNR